MRRVALLICLFLLAGCLSAEQVARTRQEWDHGICMKRGGDYDKCRVDIVAERRACEKQWYGLPPEVRAKLTQQKFETRPAEIRACNALGV